MNRLQKERTLRTQYLPVRLIKVTNQRGIKNKIISLYFILSIIIFLYYVKENQLGGNLSLYHSPGYIFTCLINQPEPGSLTWLYIYLFN